MVKSSTKRARDDDAQIDLDSSILNKTATKKARRSSRPSASEPEDDEDSMSLASARSSRSNQSVRSSQSQRSATLSSSAAGTSAVAPRSAVKSKYATNSIQSAKKAAASSTSKETTEGHWLRRKSTGSAPPTKSSMSNALAVRDKHVSTDTSTSLAVKQQPKSSVSAKLEDTQATASLSSGASKRAAVSEQSSSTEHGAASNEEADDGNVILRVRSASLLIVLIVVAIALKAFSPSPATPNGLLPSKVFFEWPAPMWNQSVDDTQSSSDWDADLCTLKEQLDATEQHLKDLVVESVNSSMTGDQREMVEEIDTTQQLGETLADVENILNDYQIDESSDLNNISSAISTVETVLSEEEVQLQEQEGIQEIVSSYEQTDDNLHFEKAEELLQDLLSSLEETGIESVDSVDLSSTDGGEIAVEETITVEDLEVAASELDQASEVSTSFEQNAKVNEQVINGGEKTNVLNQESPPIEEQSEVEVMYAEKVRDTVLQSIQNIQNQESDSSHVFSIKDHDRVDRPTYIDYAVTPRGGRIISPRVVAVDGSVLTSPSLRYHDISKDRRLSLSSNIDGIGAFAGIVGNGLSTALTAVGRRGRQLFSSPDVLVDYHPPEFGRCFAIPGQRGKVSVRLHSPVAVREISLVHVTKAEPSFKDNQPASLLVDNSCMVNDFSVIGWTADPSFAVEHAHSFNMGVHKFNNDEAITQESGEGVVTQTFQMPNKDVLDDREIPPLQAITLVVLSNHGDEDFTCLYRVRVMGESNDVDY